MDAFITMIKWVIEYIIKFIKTVLNIDIVNINDFDKSTLMINSKEPIGILVGVLAIIGIVIGFIKKLKK